jgi:hypothetical protein
LSRLQITNGDVVAGLLRQAGVPGDRIPWRDLLHEGPVPRGLSLDELSRLRARFIAGSLDDRPLDRVLAGFSERDEQLKGFKRFDEVTLWFEHDLYDQLQLIQILSWFGRRELGRTRLSLVCIDAHPDVERFLGLGQLAPRQLAELDAARTEVGRSMLELAIQAWDAFGSDRPTALAALAAAKPAGLPFLQPAIRRHMEQFPWTRDGLSRTERQILETVLPDRADLRTVFEVSQIEREEAPFLGDRAFLYHLERIGGGESKLVQIVDAYGRPAEGDPFSVEDVWEHRVQLTEIGRKILAGQADAVRMFGIDRWLGGVHLRGDHAAWRWDDRRGAIIPLSA